MGAFSGPDSHNLFMCRNLRTLAWNVAVFCRMAFGQMAPLCILYVQALYCLFATYVLPIPSDEHLGIHRSE